MQRSLLTTEVHDYNVAVLGISVVILVCLATTTLCI